MASSSRPRPKLARTFEVACTDRGIPIVQHDVTARVHAWPGQPVLLALLLVKNTVINPINLNLI